MKAYQHLTSPVGILTLVEEEGSLTGLLFGSLTPEDGSLKNTSLLQEAVRQLEEYFAGQRREFSLPLSPRGTAFQRQVWEALCTIPYGETRSYGEIARQIGSPKACRAVGMANHRNPLSIVIPCHRVVGAHGTLTGYGGGLAAKEFLLRLERENVG